MIFHNVPFLLIVGVMMPSMIVYQLYKVNKANQFKNPKWLFQLGFFYYGYTQKYYYWEFVILLRKIIFIAVNIAMRTTVSLNATY